MLARSYGRYSLSRFNFFFFSTFTRKNCFLGKNQYKGYYMAVRRLEISLGAWKKYLTGERSERVKYFEHESSIYHVNINGKLNHSLWYVYRYIYMYILSIIKQQWSLHMWDNMLSPLKCEDIMFWAKANSVFHRYPYNENEYPGLFVVYYPKLRSIQSPMSSTRVEHLQAQIGR